jgi:hypothetical protein
VRPDNTRYDGMFEVPTFDEVLDLIRQGEQAVVFVASAQPLPQPRPHPQDQD